jgi:hypothetical protein
MNPQLLIINILGFLLGFVSYDAYFKPKPLSPCILEQKEHPMPKTKKEIEALTKQYNNQDKGWIKP